MVTRLTLAILLLGISPASAPQATEQTCFVKRDKHGKIHRSSTARHAFVKAQACPSTGQHRLPCPGYRIDHIQPLKRCGADTPDNMQWLTIEEWKAKTRWE